MSISKAILCATLGATLAGCGVPATILSAFDAPLNPGTPIQTSPGNFTLTADDVAAPVANAAAVQQVAATCAVFGLNGRVVDTSSVSRDGRTYFTINFQCQ